MSIIVFCDDHTNNRNILAKQVQFVDTDFEHMHINFVYSRIEFNFNEIICWSTTIQQNVI